LPVLSQIHLQDKEKDCFHFMYSPRGHFQGPIHNKEPTFFLTSAF